ncbi:MAG: tetratricopeptide repeat protein, partial [Myxococcales bacterium]|nr:tetratricopeptide repeat protein [Myxococcales bacterium]
VAFIAFDMVLRFGDDSATLATGKQLMAILADNSSGELVDLARAASTAADGQATAAQAMMTALGGRLPGDIDAAVLAGEVALAAGAKDAEATWKAALDVQKSARTLFGMARAQRAADKVDEAEKTAREVLKLSKDHAGARTIVAAALWGRDRKDPEVLKLLEEVIKPGAVHDAASQNEVVLALALQGDVYLSQSKMTAAEKAFGEALKIDPKSERALIGNGELLYQAGRPSEALARFSRVAPDNIEGAIGKAKSMIALERAKEAKALLTPLAKSNKHPLVGYWLGQALLALGEREEAETAYRKAIEVGGSHPDVVQPYVALADLLDSRGEAAEAEKILAEASEKLPKSVALHIAKGDVALKAGRVDEAKKEFRAALAIVANNSLAEFRLGVAHRRAGEYAIAAQQFDKVGKDDPEFPGLALERGLLFQEQGKLDEALKMYADALEKAPDDIDLKMRVASTQVISGHPDQALPLLREVIKKRPQSGEANHFLGRALLVMGDNAGEALRFLQSAVQHDPNQAEYHLYVAWAANETGNLGLAQEEIDKALAINGDLGDAYWQKGVLLQKKGATRDALEELSIALEKNPTRYEAYAAMALCYQDQTQLNLAEDAWRKAVEGNKWVPEWQYRLGVLLFDRGAKDEAAPFLERAVDLMAERKQTAVWLWKANFLLGETLRNSDPKRALTAYEEFMRLAKSENAYWADAKAAVEQLKKRP